MRRTFARFGSAALTCGMTVGLGTALLMSCSDPAPKKTSTPTTYDAGYPYTPDPDPYPTGTSSGSTSGFGTSSGTSGTSSGTSGYTGTGCDRTLDLTRIRGCENFIQGARVCADNNDLNNIQSYPFTDTKSRDVVTCNNPNASCVEHCQFDCVRMPSGFPDECDLCNGRIDGSYCGRDLGWATKNADVLVRCQSNRVDTSPSPQPCNIRCENTGAQGTARCVN